MPEFLAGDAVVIIGSGPSLTRYQADQVREAAVRTIAINDVGRAPVGYAPWADILYACDAIWWDTYEGVPKFAGQKWTQIHADTDETNAARFGLNAVKGVDGIGLSFDPEILHTGSNSGFQALNLAVLMGATTIILLGYDMGRTNGAAHFFGDHPQHLNRTGSFKDWIRNFDPIPDQILDKGIEIINCTAVTNLHAFPKAELKETLCNL